MTIKMCGLTTRVRKKSAWIAAVASHSIKTGCPDPGSGLSKNTTIILRVAHLWPILACPDKNKITIENAHSAIAKTKGLKTEHVHKKCTWIHTMHLTGDVWSYTKKQSLCYSIWLKISILELNKTNSLQCK